MLYYFHQITLYSCSHSTSIEISISFISVKVKFYMCSQTKTNIKMNMAKNKIYTNCHPGTNKQCSICLALKVVKKKDHILNHDVEAPISHEPWMEWENGDHYYRFIIRPKANQYEVCLGRLVKMGYETLGNETMTTPEEIVNFYLKLTKNL